MGSDGPAHLSSVSTNGNCEPYYGFQYRDSFKSIAINDNDVLKIDAESLRIILKCASVNVSHACQKQTRGYFNENTNW